MVSIYVKFNYIHHNSFKETRTGQINTKDIDTYYRNK